EYTVNGQRTLIGQWNGTTWQRVPSPSPQGAAAFYGISATSATTAWAVGESENTTVNTSSTLVEAWNGTQWQVVASPSPGADVNVFAVVVGIGPDAAWAVGSTYGNG